MLRLPRFRLVEPRTYAEAARVLRDEGAGSLDTANGTPSLRVMVVAGGTDLFPNMKRRQFTPEVLVSLWGVAGARGVRANGHVEIGAGTTLADLATDPLLRERFAALPLAAASVSTPQLRNAGTIGGNVCLDTRCNWYDQSLFWRGAEGFCMKTHPQVVCRVAPSSPRCLAVASADTVPALVALGATARVESASGTREVALADLYREDGIRYLSLARDEIVTALTLPGEAGWRSTYVKLRDRNSFDFPIASVAAAVRVDGSTVTDARVVATGLASSPLQVEDAARALTGSRLEDDAVAAAAEAVHKAARPMDNTSGTIAQRKRASRVLTERALAGLRA
ncbi:MAG TPA: FAD binding domain-containing protein [Candidatus Limnocylindria bacterium]|nr:FAD binding domain-containing protein [Candidatus Limnocylindria bacterium]